MLKGDSSPGNQKNASEEWARFQRGTVDATARYS
jgi:hypothetical protein